MKKPNMRKIIGSSKGLLIILFQLHGSRAGLFEGDTFNPPPPLSSPKFILEEDLIQYKYNFLQFLTTLSKIILSQKTADIIL